MKTSSELRKKQDQAVKEFIEREVLISLDKHKTYEGKVDNWIKRFEAIRSINGLTYGADPVAHPKLEPWEGSSDFGLPLEAITLRAIIARFVRTIFIDPICNISGRGHEDKEGAKIIQEYNDYALNEEMCFKRNFYDIMMDVGLTGDGIGKLIEADEEYDWDETYFTLLHPTTGEPIPDPSTKNEFDKEWPNGYPVEVAEDFEPQPDVTTGITPIVKEVTVTKTDKVYFGTKLIPVDPKDILLPDEADTYDYDSLPWIGHKFKKNWHWLKDRAGDPEQGEYDEEIIDKLKPQEESGKKVSTVPRLDLVEVWGKIDMPTSTSGDKNKVREVIALYAIERGELLGWIVNPYKGARMFFHWQIMPMPHKARGKSIAEFAAGIRDLTDSLLNNMVNRDTINSHPPFIYDETSGFDPEVHQFGPQEFWGVADKTKLGRLEMGNYSENRTQWVIEFSMNLLQRLFGVNDYTTGSDANSQNKTARGIMAIIGEGNFSFDTMIALLQMTNKKFFEANIKVHAKMMKDAQMEDKVFYVTESKENPFRKLSVTTASLSWNFIPKGTSVDNNTQRRRVDAREAYDVLTKNALFNPQLTPSTADNYREVTQNYVDAYDLKGVKLPTKEEITQELIALQAAAQQKMQQQQQVAQLQNLIKTKPGSKEAMAAKKVLSDIQMQEQGQRPQPGGQPLQAPNGAQQ